jgi:hypothetical protein
MTYAYVSKQEVGGPIPSPPLTKELEIASSLLVRGAVRGVESAR